MFNLKGNFNDTGYDSVNHPKAHFRSSGNRLCFSLSTVLKYFAELRPKRM